ncbi:MAG: glycosyltransferase [Lachnospiraceae bacterium]|nr:glycosyltransferase [Lachnospiraceae bacterium]
MGISKWLMQFTSKHRDTLIKLIPISILRKEKRRLIQKNLRKAAEEGHAPFEPEAYPHGINIIGDVKAEIGLGQSARLLVNEIAHANIDYTIYQENMDGNLRADDHSCDEQITQTTPYGINLFHINPYELGVAYSNLGKELWDKRYNIVFWLWELEEFPEEWKSCFPLVDEVWTPSEFTSSSIRKVIDVPVVTIPYAVTAPIDPQYNRSYFKLPEERFLFLAMYDCNSTMDRKNPMGTIEAFKKAFPLTDNAYMNKVALVLKINNATDEDLKIIKSALAGYDNVYYLTDILSKVEVNSLIACVDVFVSLHRAEGFGLVMAEAMLNETVCIATDWSSNTEFMSNEVACMVPCKKVEIEKTNVQYKKGYHWAEPDVNIASEYMLQLVEDKGYQQQLAKKAKQYITEKLSMEQAVYHIENRIKEIYKG